MHQLNVSPLVKHDKQFFMDTMRESDESEGDPSSPPPTLVEVAEGSFEKTGISTLRRAKSSATNKVSQPVDLPSTGMRRKSSAIENVVR